MKVSVDVSIDDIFESLSVPGIVGPNPLERSRGWTVYIPGEVPCICDSFADASDMLRKELEELRKVRGET